MISNKKKNLKIDIWNENKVKASRYLWCVKYSHIIKTWILLDYISNLIYCKEKCKMVCVIIHGFLFIITIAYNLYLMKSNIKLIDMSMKCGWIN
jgi:hypothetical protein